MSLFDDATIVVRTELFTTSRPAENQLCKFKPAAAESWRNMKIEEVDVQPGGATLQIRLKSKHESA